MVGMSIRIMSQVWENGPEDRGELLVMLALADFADDRGRCWPSIATIAKRARMTTRSAQRILRKLQSEGAVTISTGTGRAGCNEYVITPDARVTPDTVSPLTPVSRPPDARVTPPLTPASPEPSLNHQEPSVTPFLFPQDEPPPKKTRRKPEVDLPEGWVPSDRNIQDATDKGLSEKEIQDEADRFRNHHYSKQSRYRDWDAAWRTWIGNALRYRKGGGVAGSAGTGYGGQRSSLAGIVARRRIEGR
jgi:DNA-binding MarR family transcriptional regulator